MRLSKATSSSLSPPLQALLVASGIPTVRSSARVEVAACLTPCAAMRLKKSSRNARLDPVIFEAPASTADVRKSHKNVNVLSAYVRSAISSMIRAGASFL
jgi:hypothetical protein